MYNELGVDLTLLLWNNSVAILAVSLVCYLASFRQTILFILVVGFSLFTGIQFTVESNYDSIAIMGFIKLILLLPFGLGAVLTYINLSELKQIKFQIWFTRYINFAVLTNIFVMVFSPDAGTYRGIVSRFACLSLLVWLIQEMLKVGFQTTLTDRKFFIFNSSPLSWIYCHALYRIALLSLPTFDSIQYLLLEPLSLVSMTVLYRWHKKRYPLPYYFGLADTLVVTTLTVLTRYPILLPFEIKDPYITNLQENQWDMIFIPIQVFVIGYALRAISKNINHLSKKKSAMNPNIAS
ncbi:hypothetical protein ND861_08445 [Leptospira sp. 2 VSF19]|uniref:Uncharacterized protein n=1 Tax=Leptospira soteropolitanensis TaxID=2950025 RepID=A0AAW5VD38_9LEPT|nr:hypothetical protein [Leptospira soteropolitanensis]MCW7493025.1 hypothetical protein [Leptospira soteropolitanensis]MCW7500260.1 hypothetical protein [Leptospira soteropolitanensis]MCW7522511.1 hypothetical protein [Leptospira soteropolitanensis]MCW7526367.1 hypothetical protein [Leptospira soteropolitanensis]MCW7529521.1 hypothetical protein [Leptospira soteropolitanensis]